MICPKCGNGMYLDDHAGIKAWACLICGYRTYMKARKFCAERIVAQRKLKGKTQDMLSRETGLSQVSISAIETGKKEPRASTLAKFADALGCDVDYFFHKELGNCQT